MSITGRRLASGVAIGAYIFVALALAVPAPGAVILATVIVAIIAEVFVQRSSELGLPFLRRDLDERQEAQRAQLLASTYGVVMALALAGLLFFALQGERFLWLAGRASFALAPDLATSAVMWTIGIVLLVVILLPAHVAVWHARSLNERAVTEERV